MAGFLYSGSIPSPDPIDCRNVPTYALPAAAFVHSSCVRVLSSSGVCVYGLLAVGQRRRPLHSWVLWALRYVYNSVCAVVLVWLYCCYNTVWLQTPDVGRGSECCCYVFCHYYYCSLWWWWWYGVTIIAIIIYEAIPSIRQSNSLC